MSRFRNLAGATQRIKVHLETESQVAPAEEAVEKPIQALLKSVNGLNAKELGLNTIKKDLKFIDKLQVFQNMDAVTIAMRYEEADQSKILNRFSWINVRHLIRLKLEVFIWKTLLKDFAE